MSKNYKIWVYTEVPCPPCENLGTYPSSSAATKGYEFEKITLERNENGEGWISAPISDFYGTPWFKLENLDDNTIIDSFYGGNQSRFDIMMEK
jgi:hypothetical protein|tara:strand:- start:4197 stop:4475 length:279 start_codon:yes stop_codon:yes gene_type:complete